VPDITYQFVGLSALMDTIQTGAAMAKDNKAPLGKAVDVYYREVAHRFFMGDTYWRPLSEFRIAQRGSAHPILIDTGALYTAATGNVETGSSSSGFSGQDIMGWKAIRSNSAIMGIRGDKVRNNSGFQNTYQVQVMAPGGTAPIGDGPHSARYAGGVGALGRTRVPPRPFWFLDDVDAMVKPFHDQWQHWADTGKSSNPGQSTLWGP